MRDLFHILAGRWRLFTALIFLVRCLFVFLGSGIMSGVRRFVERAKKRSRVRSAVRAVPFRPQIEALEKRFVMDSIPLTMVDPNLQATVALNAGITQPVGIVFLAANDYFVLEKASGQVKRVINNTVQPTPVLDLAVNSNSERGLLSMVVAPNFPVDPSAYVFWTESSTGADTNVVLNVPLLGNRVDRFVWNGSTFSQAENVIRLRSLQTDNIATQNHPGTNNANPAGNHNGGVMELGPDGKLYVFMGDQGRRGWMQNLTNGPFFTEPRVDDTFGGPAPDNSHLSGVILRLNTDGSAPSDNPFFAAGASLGGEVGANIQKVYSYGHRNGFGMAFDPISGSLWETENADDAYAELNRVIPGMNGGWVQFAGPISRLSDWRLIEATQFTRALQQVRYPPTRAAYTQSLAMSRLHQLPGSTYVDPDLSWRYEIGPSGATFVNGNGLGAEYNGTLWMGSSRGFSQVGANGGSLYRMRLTSDRASVDVSADPRLADRVADNLFRNQKFDGTESESLLIGRGFGTTADIVQGPDGNLYVVSVTDNAIYKISRAVSGSEEAEGESSSLAAPAILSSFQPSLVSSMNYVSENSSRPAGQVGIDAIRQQRVASGSGNLRSSQADLTAQRRRTESSVRQQRTSVSVKQEVVDQLMSEWNSVSMRRRS